MRGFISTFLLMASFPTVLFISACRNTPASPTPTPVGIGLRFDDPVEARFVPTTNVMVAEFPVTIVEADGRDGQLEFLETMVFDRSRNQLIAINRRPNITHAYPDTTLPSRGELTVEAGVAFAPPPPRDDVQITVRVRLTDGREAQRTASLRQVFLSSARVAPRQSERYSRGRRRDSQCSRRASLGETRSARRAGNTRAMADAAHRSRATAPYGDGLSGLIPAGSSARCMTTPTASAVSVPRTVPRLSARTDGAATARMMSVGPAPRAIRTPISRVRWRVAYSSTLK